MEPLHKWSIAWNYPLLPQTLAFYFLISGFNSIMNGTCLLTLTPSITGALITAKDSQKTKCRIFKCNVWSVLLYQSECCKMIQTLGVFQTKSLHKIKGVFWLKWHFVKREGYDTTAETDWKEVMAMDWSHYENDGGMLTMSRPISRHIG